MSIEDLDLILKKDPIITTFPVSQMQARPDHVEQVYATHAKTHLSLGDTEKHVDTIFKWVSGKNRGAFIGAVEGNYGEGKTSFLVHVWARSSDRQVFAVPPFEWISLADGVTAVGAWMRYILGRTHPALAKKAEHVYTAFKQKSLEDVARETVKRTKGSYDTVLATLKDQEQQGVRGLTEVSAVRFLDYCAEATEIVKQAGYQGLLVLLDEPEVAAKEIGREKVAHLLFDLANELHERQGDYGALVSMPSNFLADVSRRFPALTARLQVRGCFPRLRDVYGPDFAQDLWSRYVTEFDLGEEGTHIVSPLALQAIGQVGSSDRSDLSYGPRTVVSAFSRMVFRYRETGKTYQPEDFVQDCLDQEIIVNPDYPTKIREVLRSPEVSADCRNVINLLAAFPNGLKIEIAQEKDIDRTLRDLSRRGSLVYKTASTFGLNSLRKTEGGVQADPLRDAILEIESEFAPNPSTFANALSAFRDHFVPLVFEPRKGQQLVGWDPICPWSPSKSMVWIGAFVGAFLQTQRQYPKRAVLALVSSFDNNLQDVDIPDLPIGCGPVEYDAVFHFRLRWHAEQELTTRKLEVKVGDPAQHKFAFVGITIDLLRGDVAPDALVDLVETENLTPFWLLNLIHRMDSESLPKEFDAQWQAMRSRMLRDMVPVFFGEELGALAAEQLEQPVSGSGLGLLGSLSQRILAKRYPGYSTLICSPHWDPRVDDYVRALGSREVPLACKRGREKWRVEGDLAAKVLGTSRMNLTGGAFEGMENLLVITSTGRNVPIEVEFRIHPLEQQIAELICTEKCGPDRKLKIDGKECWWMPIKDLLPLIQTSGYTVEELEKIVEIGTARGSFNRTERKGERILYCKPIDPEQMRRQLQDKLADLTRESDEFRKLPGFHSRFDAEAVATQIAIVQDEADYDRLVTRLNKEFEQLHQRLSPYFDRLEESLQTARNEVQAVAGQLASSREVATLKTIPASKSPWGASLGRYIVGNLKQTVEELRAEATSLLSSVNTHIARFKYQPTLPPDNNVALLIEGNSASGDVMARAKSLKSRAGELVTNLRDYEEWLKLLRRSDEVYEALLQLQSRELDRAAVEAFLGDYDQFCRDVSDHLEVRNVQGLSGHKQYTANLEAIDKKRQTYLSQLKGEFDRRKGAVNRILEELKLDRRVTVTFNPMSSDTCYEELFEQGAAHIREAAISRSLAEIEAQERELMYARNILMSVEDTQSAPLLTRLSAAQANLAALNDRISKEWVRTATEQDAAEDTAGIAETIDDALDAVRMARQLVKSTAKATPPAEGRSKFMYDLICQSGNMDLKELALRMMPGAESPARALDESLVCLVELFRSNCIQIRVERRRE